MKHGRNIFTSKQVGQQEQQQQAEVGRIPGVQQRNQDTCLLRTEAAERFAQVSETSDWRCQRTAVHPSVATVVMQQVLDLVVAMLQKTTTTRTAVACCWLQGAASI